MRTLQLFTIVYVLCSVTGINAQINNVIAPDSIITKPEGNGYTSVVQPDGKILVGGNSPGKTSTNLTVVRYNKNGSIDKDFGNNGKAIAKFGGNATANSIALQPDGKIVAGGVGNNDFVLARFNADGSVDSSFGKKGKISRDFEGYQDEINKLVLQPDNKIVAVGYGFEANHELTKVILMRFNPDGASDDSFGDSGITAVHVNENGFDYASTALLKQDGKILVAGYSYTNSAYDFTLTQFTSNGKVDSAYGTNGHIYTDIMGFDLAKALAVQSNGKIVVAGYSDFFESKFVLVRYTKDGLPDSSFGNDGKIMTKVARIDDKAYSIAIQPDDKIVVAGYSYNGSNTDLALVRYNKNGARDKSFGIDGKVITDVNGDDAAHAVNILHNGKILVAGYSSGKFLLAWYSMNGSLLLNTGITDATINKSSLAARDIKIYPNPVRDLLIVNGLDASHKTTLTVIDATGKTVQQTSVQAGSYSWNIKQLHVGVYYLQVDENIQASADRKSFSIKFIKE